MNVASPLNVDVWTVALAVTRTDTFVVPVRLDPPVETSDPTVVAPEHVTCVVATENMLAVDAVFRVPRIAVPLAMFRVVRLAVPATRVVTLAVVRLPVVTNALDVLIVVTFAVAAVRFVVVTVFVTARFCNDTVFETVNVFVRVRGV